MTFVTTPEPTVRPPSRMANRTSSSMAIGVFNSICTLDVVAGHAHFGVAQQLGRAGHVRRAEVELRAVAAEERRVPAAFFLRQARRPRPRTSVCGVIEPGLASTWPRSISSRLMPRSRQPTLSPAWPWSSVLLNISTPVQIVLRLSGVKPDDLDFVAHLDDAPLDTARGHGAAAFDREHVFDRHQERLVHFACRLGNVASIASISSPMHLLAAGSAGLL